VVAFELEDVEGLEKHVKGLPADLLIDICKGFVAALNADATGTARLTARQIIRSSCYPKSPVAHRLSLRADSCGFVFGTQRVRRSVAPPGVLA